MRYLIEYLHETTDEYSVCHTREIEAQEVVEAGHLARSKQFEFPEATGFQIRAGNRVVAIEDFCTDLESRTVH